MSTHNIYFYGEITKTRLHSRWHAISKSPHSILMLLIMWWTDRGKNNVNNVMDGQNNVKYPSHVIPPSGLGGANIRARENRKNNRSGPKLRILDRFQTPQNANKSVQQVCALNPIFPKPTNFHKSMMSKKSQTVKSFQTDNVRAPFKCDIMVVKRL